jgi:hypothetical protein
MINLSSVEKCQQRTILWPFESLLSNYHLYYNLDFILPLLTNFDLQFYRLTPIIENIVVRVSHSAQRIRGGCGTENTPHSHLAKKPLFYSRQAFLGLIKGYPRAMASFTI